MSNTLAATAQALAFLGAFASIAVLCAMAILLLLMHRVRWARWSLAIGALLTGAYVVALVVVGASSSTLVLGAGHGKAFCELDCHIVYDVLSTHDSENAHVAVTVREQFDASSISARRDNGPITPGTRVFALLDTQGRRYLPMSIAMIDGAPLFADMRPGEAHRSTLAFTVRRDVHVLGLLVEDSDLISTLLIGHERSPFHGKVLLPIGS